MKRLFATLLALTMALSLAACGGSKDTTPAEDPSDTQEPADEETTDKELSGDLVLYSSMTESDLDALITCFNEKYPDINVEVVNGSAGELTTRLAGEASNPVGDLVWGGMADSDGDRYADIFEKWVSDYDSETISGYSTPTACTPWTTCPPLSSASTRTWSLSWASRSSPMRIC